MVLVSRGYKGQGRVGKRNDYGRGLTGDDVTGDVPHRGLLTVLNLFTELCSLSLKGATPGPRYPHSLVLSMSVPSGWRRL